MLRTLGPDDPATDGKIAFFGAIFFLVLGLFYWRFGERVFRRWGCSEDHVEIAMANVPTMCFVMTVVSLFFSFMFYSGRW
jgi:hypothetical protein